MHVLLVGRVAGKRFSWYIYKILSLCVGISGGRFRRAFSIKSSVLSGKIVACQESFFVVRLLVSSAQPQRRRRRENISKTKTLNVRHTFWQVSLPSLLDERCQTWLKWQCNRRTTFKGDAHQPEVTFFVHFRAMVLPEFPVKSSL